MTSRVNEWRRKLEKAFDASFIKWHKLNSPRGFSLKHGSMSPLNTRKEPRKPVHLLSVFQKYEEIHIGEPCGMSHCITSKEDEAVNVFSIGVEKDLYFLHRPTGLFRIKAQPVDNRNRSGLITVSGRNIC